MVRLAKGVSLILLLAFMSTALAASPGHAEPITWSAPLAIGTGFGGQYESPSSASNILGQIVVAWAAWQENASGFVLANRYVPGQGWAGTEVLVENIDVIGYTVAGIDDSGNCLVVWAQGPSIQSRTYILGVGWGPIVQVSSSSTSRWFYDVKMAVAPDGSAMVIWKEDTMEAYGPVHAVYKPVGSGWQKPSVFQTTSSYVENVRLVVDGEGNFMTVFTMCVDSEWGVWANTFTRSSGWGKEALIESHPGAAYDVNVAMNRAGQAVAAWQQFGYPYDNFPVAYAGRYIPGSGWETQVRIEDPSFGGSDPPVVSIDIAGNAVILWRSVAIDMMSSCLRWNTYLVSSGWGSPATLQHSDGSIDEHVSVGISGSESFAAWIRVVIIDNYFAGSELVANHSNITDGWEMPVVLTPDIASSPSVTADNLGGAAIFWHENETAPAMFVSQYLAPNPPQPPPAGISASIDFEPNTLNPRSMGRWVTVYVALPSGYDVSDILVESVKLNGQFPATGPHEIGDFNKDKVQELMVKFDWRKDLRVGEVAEKETMTLTVSGKLDNGTAFQGTDDITILPSSHGSSALSIIGGEIGPASILTIATMVGVVLSAALLVRLRRASRHPLPP